MRKSFIVLLLVLTVVLMSFGSVSASDSVTAYVVHGIPNLPVDIYVDGVLFVADFQPGTIAGPLVGPAGVFADLVIVPTGGDPANPALSARLGFTAGQNVTAVAHLTENGTPTLSLFENNVSPTSDARITVRHLAAAPAVDALLFPGTADQIRVGPLSNGDEVVTELAPGSYTAGLAPAGTDTVIFGPQSMMLESGKGYFAFAIGSLADGTFTMLLQVIDL